ncbi:Nn.00g116770.m01.CDS01 [Neocucurbitaria sp. VM-36]
MFSNLQLRPAKPHRRKPSMAAKAGVMKRRVSTVSPASASNVPSMSFMESLFGDEFPETFAGSSGRAAKSSTSLIDLPAELLAMICEHFSSLDVKRLRISSRYLAANVDLRIDRIYISPNFANLDCLQQVLAHSTYKNRVQELVWDDAQLDEYPTQDSFTHAISVDEAKTTRDIERRLELAISGHEDASPEYRALERDDFFSQDGQLTEIAKAILLRYEDQFSRDMIARNKMIMSVEQSYALYQRLYQEEQEIIRQSLDVTALHRAMAEFPNLKRITLTSEVWRPWNFYPHYDTPFYRSLPPGFRKPSVWPWLGPRPRAIPAQHMHRDSVMSEMRIDGLPKEFRGYSIIVSTLLAIPNPRVEEFIIDAGNEYTGITHQLLAQNNSVFHDTVRILHLIPLKRLQLVLNSHKSYRRLDWFSAFPLLKQALSGLRFLEHLDLNLHWRARWYNHGLLEWVSDATQLLPEDMLRRLKTFALRNVYTLENGLIELLQNLASAEHVTLDNVDLMGIASFGDVETTWFRLLHRLKAHYATVSSVSHPKFTWIRPFGDEKNHIRSNLVDDDFDAFLYDGAECPFEDRRDLFLKDGVGWMVDDRDRSFKMKVLKKNVWNLEGSYVDVG